MTATASTNIGLVVPASGLPVTRKGPHPCRSLTARSAASTAARKTETGYTGTHFLQVLAAEGSLATPRRLVPSTKPSEGIDRTVGREAARSNRRGPRRIIRDFRVMFSDQEIGAAGNRCSQYRDQHGQRDGWRRAESLRAEVDLTLVTSANWVLIRVVVAAGRAGTPGLGVSRAAPRPAAVRSGCCRKVRLPPPGRWP